MALEADGEDHHAEQAAELHCDLQNQGCRYAVPEDVDHSRTCITRWEQRTGGRRVAQPERRSRVPRGGPHATTAQRRIRQRNGMSTSNDQNRT
jgi:hypothetical protein